MDGRDPTFATQIVPALSTRRLSLLRALGGGALVGLLIALGAEIYSVAVLGHIHEVIPGSVYRCSQPSPERLESLVKKYGIRTVINLRGCCFPSPWYVDQCRMSAKLDLSLEDLPFSAGRLPSVPVIRHLVEVLDHSERPILVHCHQGIDRTGMTSTLALLLYTDLSLDEALHQLSPRFGHLPLGRTGNIDRFFELYREWLDAKGLTHSQKIFRRWVEHEYCPGECRADIEILTPTSEPLVFQQGEPTALSVRCTNRSVKPWRFRPGTNAGIHLFWQLLSSQRELVAGGRAGMFHAEVSPGNSIELTLAIPTLSIPGRYRLRVDMVDEQHAHFHQLGPEPLEVEVEVR